jgi:hypothetical protein
VTIYDLLTQSKPQRFPETPAQLQKYGHKKIRKKARSVWNDPKARESSRQPVIPPAPLTGDAGRGCGDASRAPDFFDLVDF